MSLRTDLADQLRADWASIEALADFRVIATERQLDAVAVPTALIRQKSIARLPTAPLSHVTTGLSLTLIAPYADLDLAADLLDDAVPAALDYLRPRYQADSATVADWSSKQLAYDIDLSVIARTSPTAAPATPEE